MQDFYKSDNSFGPYVIVSRQPESPSHKDCIERFIPGHSLWPFSELKSQPGVLLDGFFEVEVDGDWSYLIAGQQDELLSLKDYVGHFILGLGVLSLAIIEVGRSTWVYFWSSFWGESDGDWSFLIADP